MDWQLLAEWLRGVLDEDERYHEMDTESANRLPIFRWRFPLADIAAKRALLDALMEPTTASNVADEEGLMTAVQIIATAYADRPGYREEWQR
jgi:hypothetical protein